MIYHGIRFSLRPGVSEEQVTAGLDAMRAASLSIPTIRSFVIGRDIGGDYDFGAVSVIEDIEGYEAMMNHPAHLEIDRAGLPLVARFASFDISDDPDPAIGAKIAEIHWRRYRENPDVAELVAGLDEYSGSAGDLT